MIRSPSRRATAASTRRLHGGALISVVAALMLTLLLEALDQTIVGTAMPRIIGQLHGLDRYTWAVSAYLLASTTTIPIAARLSDQFGRKWFLLGGTILFLVGSALCGAAQTIDHLIVFRALQGAGAGIGIALVFTLIGDIFPPAERGRWQGIVTSVYVISSVIGPTLGGWLADHGPLVGSLVTDASRWRWVFYVNLPLGILALIMLVRYLPGDISARDSDDTGWAAVRHVDVTGALLTAAATLCLLLGLTWGSEAATSWGQPRVVGILLGAIFLFVMLLIAERAAIVPILPLDLFRNRVFAAVAALSLLLNMALIGMAFYVPLFLQEVLGASATQSGATMTPFSVSIAVAGSLAGMAISALKRHQVIAMLGALLMTTGIFLLARMTPEITLAQVSIAVAVAGMGMGTLFPTIGVAALNTLPPTRLGAGMGAIRYLSQIGGTVGAAVVGTVVNISLAADLSRRLSTATVRRLAADGIAVAVNPQALVSPAYRQTLARHALATAAARVPVGPRHDQLEVAVTWQAHQILQQVFEAFRFSLATAIQHGLLTVLLFCGGAFLAACFVRDAPSKEL
jgi:EmrB/QacA subfamily drug resistance transporter